MNTRRKLATIIGASPIPKLVENIKLHPRVIFFHGITDTEIVDKMPQACQAQFHDFKKLISYLLNSKYNFLSLDELYKRLANHDKLNGKDVILTFDDGYKNNYTTVAPYLSKLNIPFSVFICAKYIETGERIPAYYISAAIFNKKINALAINCINKLYNLRSNEDRWKAYYDLFQIITTANNDLVNEIISEIKSTLGTTELNRLRYIHSTEDLMNWKEVKEIQNYGCTIGSHCMEHTILHPNQSTNEIEYQLHESKKIISQNIGKCDYFSYPNGNRVSVCHEAQKIASNYYKLAFGVDGKSIGKIYDPTFVSRISVEADLNIFKSQFSILSR